jgi:diguanylate cyclase (GGDEF)-like protein
MRQPHDAQPVGAPTISRDLVAMLDLLAETIVYSLGFGVACINIARPDGTLEAVAVAGDEGAQQALLGTRDSTDVWDQLLAASEPWGRLRFSDHRTNAAITDVMVWVPDVEVGEDENAWHPEDALFAPLVAEDGTRLGILSVDLPPGGVRPSEATQRALEGFAVSTALAIEHATLRARAEASERLLLLQSSLDPLTGVGNRSMLFERLRHASSARPGRRPLMALAFIDLDGFKRVNDVFSHTVGDEVLTTAAQRIQAVVRPHDTVVRWGGDEFLVLLEHLEDESAALTVAQRITAAVGAPLEHAGAELGITASVGLSFQGPEDDFDADELVRRADTAMYSVKHGGRNGHAVYETETETEAG